MKYIYLLLTLSIFTSSQAQIINFPDANLKNALLLPGRARTCGSGQLVSIDTNSDGEIQVSEAELICSISIQGGGIQDLEGLDQFANLDNITFKTLSVSDYDFSAFPDLVAISIINNSVTMNSINLTSNALLIRCNLVNDGLPTIDVTNNLVLEELLIGNNELETIDVTNNFNLKKLNFGGNNLTSIDVLNNTALTFLGADANNMTTLDVSQNTLLESLTLGSNDLTDVDVSNNPLLTFFVTGDNPINTLDVSNLTNLLSLFCQTNGLTSLDVSNSPNLIYLDCSNNDLTSLDMTNNIKLQRFFCQNNQLASFNTLSCDTLLMIDCGNNLLENIDVTANSKLHTLSCSYNSLSTIDITNNPLMNNFKCRNNNIESLDLYSNEVLLQFDCRSNPIEFLDFSNNYLIQSFNANDNEQLQYVIMKNGAFTENINLVGLSNCTALEYICADVEEIGVIGIICDNYNLNVNVINYCSFNPGGNYNKIHGDVVFDLDNDGCDNDEIFPFSKVNINDGTENGITFTDNGGHYLFYTDTGTFNVQTMPMVSDYFIVTPEDANMNFPNTDNNVVEQDFCITANGVHNDVLIVIAPASNAVPGFVAKYNLSFVNVGNTVLSGEIVFNYQDDILSVLSISETPISQTTGSMTFSYSDLLPFENRVINVDFDLNTPTDTPPVNIDDILSFTASIDPIIDDETTDNNDFTFDQLVVSSYDPNDITCVEGDSEPVTNIGEALHYIINFENTGNFPAQNIVVKLLIDPTQFDINSLGLLNSSHDVYAVITGDVLELIFEDIVLEYGGHGNILFMINTLEELEVNSSVSNACDIYFDYNFPVATNIANTVFQDIIKNNNLPLDNTISISPNPVADYVLISSDNDIKTISIYDVNGRVLQTKITQSKSVTLDLETMDNGLFFVKITTNRGVKIDKIIKK